MFSASSISLLLNLRFPIPKHIFQLDNNELQLLFDDHVTQMYANGVLKLFKEAYMYMTITSAYMQLLQGLEYLIIISQKTVQYLNTSINRIGKGF